jgi:hypothetical protein
MFQYQSRYDENIEYFVLCLSTFWLSTTLRQPLSFAKQTVKLERFCKKFEFYFCLPGYDYPVPEVTLPVRPVTTTLAPIPITTPSALYGAPPPGAPGGAPRRQGDNYIKLFNEVVD